MHWKREQLQREQALRAHSVLSLDEIGRRIARGGTKRAQPYCKGRRGRFSRGTERLARKELSTEKIKVNVILKSVGQISENDVSLAAASQAIIIGFQVRPSVLAKEAGRPARRRHTPLLNYIRRNRRSKSRNGGMLEPVVKEEVTATVEVRQVFHISKVGFVAGAFVTDGKVSRSDKARLIRDGIVIQTANIAALKRFKDDVRAGGSQLRVRHKPAKLQRHQGRRHNRNIQEVEVKAEL